MSKEPRKVSRLTYGITRFIGNLFIYEQFRPQNNRSLSSQIAGSFFVHQQLPYHVRTLSQALQCIQTLFRSHALTAQWKTIAPLNRHPAIFHVNFASMPLQPAASHWKEKTNSLTYDRCCACNDSTNDISYFIAPFFLSFANIHYPLHMLAAPLASSATDIVRKGVSSL